MSSVRPSWQSRCVNRLLWKLRVKRHTASAQAVHDHLRRTALRPAPYAPVGLGRGVDVTAAYVAGWPVYHTVPRGDAGTRHHVVFLHGGGFINEIVRAHWRFVGHLTRTARVRCVVPIYPLVPRATAADLVPATGALLRRLLDDAGPDHVTLAGNSAGANLALAAALWLRDAGLPQPRRLVLLSPGLDFAADAADRAALAAVDPVNDLPGTLEIGRLYAGDLGVAHPWVSPLRGDLRGLAPMTVLSGTLDFLYPDCVALADKARAAGVAVDLHVRAGQPHNYAGMPTPEGREALGIILRAVAPPAPGR